MSDWYRKEGLGGAVFKRLSPGYYERYTPGGVLCYTTREDDSQMYSIDPPSFAPETRSPRAATSRPPFDRLCVCGAPGSEHFRDGRKGRNPDTGCRGYRIAYVDRKILPEAYVPPVRVIRKELEGE